MIREELEFRIACYADGTLPATQRAAVEAVVAADPQARALLAEYQALQRSLAEAPPTPEFRWDRLADRLSAEVALAAAAGDAGDAEVQDDGRAAALEAVLAEETQFAIACFADGTASPEQRGEVERLLASDAAARTLHEEYQNLDATVRATAYDAALPPVDWDGLAGRLSDAVAAGARQELSEESERQIAAYADGAPAAAERDAVEARLASEPAARVALSEYRSLNAALAALPASAPLPSVDWDRLAGRISKAVGHEVERREAEERDAAAEPAPAASFPIWNWLRSPVRLAAAASVLIAALFGARLIHRGGVKPNTPDTVAVAPASQPVTPPVSVAEVGGLKPEAAAGPSVAEVRIGPPKEMAEAEGDDTEGVVSSPPRAFVASGEPIPVRSADVLPAMPF